MSPVSNGDQSFAPGALGTTGNNFTDPGAGYVRDSGIASEIILSGRVVVGAAGGGLALPRSSNDVAKARGVALIPIDLFNSGANPFNSWSYAATDPVLYLRSGCVWVFVENPVLEFGTVWVRFTAGPNGTNLGAIRGDSDGGTCAALPIKRAQFANAATSRALVRLNLP